MTTMRSASSWAKSVSVTGANSNSGVGFTALLSIPLGFTSTRGFVITRTFYGAYTGFLLERHAQERPVWQWALETLGFTAFIFFMEVVVIGR